MHDNRTHPLLAQIPLTVSPFVSLPTAATLPYTYKPMPSSLPPSSSGITSTTAAAAVANEPADSGSNKPRYVVSASGHAAHPDDIMASCKALQSHISQMQADAERELRELDERIRERELAEKRRVAPGWLDSEVRVLEPERKVEVGSPGPGLDDGTVGASTSGDDNSNSNMAGQFAEMSLADRQGASEMAGDLDQGAELDRAFGGK
ncbi:hypothetical protein BKA67DRAFT_534274 [Truncatella angustata]|uniref:Uncharacterized protein n=1 Tax=Truncatella angustata TaxID=152316 RepID=A0A9P8ZZR2_9PEZI|nr:uncharacterized protein BKA67DRAFT_534274 [Truncatella angustata]KAH6655345.1 hypothetical protein BKA67DRAFT_534274 [Truncatella angustata]KAH8196370.1 hypothetical protein TruAng_009453 [Truncatella angustata]